MVAGSAKADRTLNKTGMNLRDSSYGFWRVISESLAAETRRLLNGNIEEEHRARSLYRTSDLEYVEVLTSKSLAAVLQSANAERNRWRGHGGAMTRNEASSRHAALRGLLDEIRSTLGKAFDRYSLLELGTAELLEDPTYRYQTRRVMGSNPQLEHGLLELTTRTRSGSLVMHNRNHNECLTLLRLMKLTDAPQPAAYFYNGLNGEKLRFVAYQFAAASQIEDDSEDFGLLIRNLLQAFET